MIRIGPPLEVSLDPVAVCDTVKPDNTPHDVILRSPHAGLHRIEITDGGDYTRIVWPVAMPVAMPAGLDTPRVKNHFRGAWTLYFYVPKGTRTVTGWASRIANWAPRIAGTLADADGTVHLDFATVEDGWFSVPVPVGQDGRCWSFRDSQGERLLATVPPLLAISPDRLLLPREVVERDRDGGR